MREKLTPENFLGRKDVFFLLSWTTSVKYVLRTLGHENIGAQVAHEGGGNYLETNAHYSIYALQRVRSPDSEQGPPVELISVTLIKRGKVFRILVLIYGRCGIFFLGYFFLYFESYCIYM